MAAKEREVEHEKLQKEELRHDVAKFHEAYGSLHVVRGKQEGGDEAETSEMAAKILEEHKTKMATAVPQPMAAPASPAAGSMVVPGQPGIMGYFKGKGAPSPVDDQKPSEKTASDEFSRHKMEPAGLLSLPIEVLHLIGHFLPVEDILTCSATCHYLRYAFNNNTVWKKYLPVSTLELQSQDLSLEPTSCITGTLTPLCKNRVTFMKKVNLLNNWKNGKFVQHVVDVSFGYDIDNCESYRYLKEAIYKDRYLFVRHMTVQDLISAIEVWDISKEPVVLIKLMMDDPYYEHFYIVGDRLVIVGLVHISVHEIKISEKALPLLFTLMNEHEHNGNFYSEPSMVDQYLFVSNLVDEQRNTCDFQVWDILNASKVGSFCSPISCSSITYRSHKGSKWLLEMTDASCNTYVHFNIERKLFSENVFILDNKSIVHSIVYDSCLIVFRRLMLRGSKLICSVHDINTSKKLQVRCFEQDSYDDYRTTEVVNRQFVLGFINGFHVINALTLETLQHIPTEGHYCIAYQLNIHGSVFIVSVRDWHRYQLWDISKEKNVAKHFFDEKAMFNMYINASCTRLVRASHDKLSIYYYL